MSLELAAIRILAPHFGDSAYVWTNVIGVLLVALAFGAWVGGRLANRERGARRLAGMLIAASVVTAATPLVAPSLGAWLVPQDIALDRAMRTLVSGSLVATILLFAAPVLLAGAVTPMIVTSLATDSARIASSSALVACWSTLGSLAGTFAATHMLLPGLGSRRTIWLCATVLAIAGVVSARAPRVAPIVLVPLLFMTLPAGPLRTPTGGRVLLAEVESPYQYLQVVRDIEATPPVTSLLINEGLDSFHSVLLDGSALTGGRYYDYHALLPVLLGKSMPPGIRVLSLGSAAGTFERVFRHLHPAARFTSVEIDREAVRLGREFFAAYSGDTVVFDDLDARVYVEHCKEEFDIVLVDAYERQIYLPSHLASREFFRSVKRILVPGGIVSVNVGGQDFDDAVVASVGSTMASVFGAAKAFRVPRSRNFMIIARSEMSVAMELVDRARHDDEEVMTLIAHFRRPLAWRDFDASGRILEDDQPFLDRLQEKALRQSRSAGGLLAVAGNLAPEQIESEAFQLAVAADWRGVLQRIKEAREASRYLRYLAGEAKWHMRDLTGARLEYLDAARLPGDAVTDEALAGRLAALGEDSAAAELAERLEVRNTLLAALACVAFAALALVAQRLPCG